MKSKSLQHTKTHDGFIGKKELLKRLPISESTLNSWMRDGLVPFTKLVPTRRGRVLFDWSSVQSALNKEGKKHDEKQHFAGG